MTLKKITVASLVLCLSTLCLAQSYDYLVREAEKTLASGKYQETLDLYEKALKSGEFHYNDYINAAVACAQLGRSDNAFAYLHEAIKAGFIEKTRLEKNSRLVGLRQDPRWQKVMDELEEKTETIASFFPETHPEGEVVGLPEPNLTGDVSVEEALKNRRSVRSYADKPMTLEEISQLLWAAFGITRPVEDGPEFLRGGFRTAPSAGALYPLDLYVVARNVQGLPAGVYWYKSEEHTLVRISQEDKWEALSASAFHQPHFKTAAAAIVYSAVFDRNMRKYGQRGRERYVCMDLGHSAENVYLQAYALKIGTCAIGAFVDLWLKEVVGMTKEEEPLYIMPLGKVE